MIHFSCNNWVLCKHVFQSNNNRIQINPPNPCGDSFSLFFCYINETHCHNVNIWSVFRRIYKWAIVSTILFVFKNALKECMQQQQKNRHANCQLVVNVKDKRKRKLTRWSNLWLCIRVFLECNVRLSDTFDKSIAPF